MIQQVKTENLKFKEAAMQTQKNEKKKELSVSQSNKQLMNHDQKSHQ